MFMNIPKMPDPAKSEIAAAMKLRNQFAMAALTGIVTRNETYGPDDIDSKVVTAFEFADAMMAHRGK